MKKKYISLFIGIFIFLILVLFSYFEQYNLKKNKILINGEFLEYKSGGNKSGDWINYKYEYKSKTYKGSIRKVVYSRNFIGKSFPTVINSKNPSSSEMLILPEDFEEFGYTFPDTLKWVLKYKY
jgi:hypothetical protein